MAEQVLLNTPHVLSALSPANSRYSRPRRRPLRASGRLLRLAAEGDLVAPWRCSLCIAYLSLARPRGEGGAQERARARGRAGAVCCLGADSAGGAGGVQKRRAGRDLGALRERLQPLEKLRIGARSSAGGAELLDPVPLRSNRLGLGPLDQHPRCLVAPLTSAHNYPATTKQRPAPYVL